MKLIVKNFGAIKESVIDLSKRYYFFVGYNNECITNCLLFRRRANKFARY